MMNMFDLVNRILRVTSSRRALFPWQPGRLVDLAPPPKMRGKCSGSFTKRGPGRFHMSGEPRSTTIGTVYDKSMTDEERYKAGYMHRGERERFLEKESA